MKKLFMLALLLLLVGCSGKEGKITQITCEEMKKMMADSEAVLLDVRSEQEFTEGHIDNAQNRPLTEVDELELDKETPIIVYCKSGIRSNEAAKILLENGFKNIYDLGSMIKCS